MSLAKSMTPIFEPASSTGHADSSAIGVRDVVKQFGSQKVLQGVSLDVGAGETLVVLGPSGSGKTTLLRIIAGLEQPDTGEVLLRSLSVNHLPTQKRQLGVVFQEQALFQKMTAKLNIAFGLRVRRFPRAVIRKTVDEMLELTNLKEHQHKYPSQLSGGQRQRVALARALAYKPQAMLFDEPFSALDPLTRSELRKEVKQLLRELRISSLFITHDQQEALELGDRIAVLRNGVIEQQGTPADIYDRPENEFIATSLGTANAFPAVLRNKHAVTGPLRLPVPSVNWSPLFEGRRVKVVFRPEDLVLGVRPVWTNAPFQLGQGLVESISYFGSTERLVIRLLLRYTPHQNNGHPQASLSLVSQPQSDDVFITATRTKWEARDTPIAVHDGVIVGLKDFRVLSAPCCSET